MKKGILLKKNPKTALGLVIYHMTHVPYNLD